MKKLALILFALVMLVSLTACVEFDEIEDDVDITTDDTSYTEDITEFKYEGYWMYGNEYILQMTSDFDWYLYGENGELIQSGILQYDDEAAYLISADGSSGGGTVSFDDEGRLKDDEEVLTKLDSFPFGSSENDNLNAQLAGEWLYSDHENILTFDGINGYTWLLDGETISGTYTFDGTEVDFDAVEGGFGRGTIGDGGLLFIEGDAGSYYYRKDGSAFDEN